jgi:hypothetical protein
MNFEFFIIPEQLLILPTIYITDNRDWHAYRFTVSFAWINLCFSVNVGRNK